MQGVVIAVHRRPTHRLAKDTQESITLLEGVGVEGDAHAGATVQHRSRKRFKAELPNLRQVHLIAAELHDELDQQGFRVGPGEMGENVTTRGLDLIELPTGTRLHLGSEAIVEVTGLRTPCVQLDRWQQGLMKATLDRDEEGNLIRKAGVMGVVIAGGQIRADDQIAVTLPERHEPLQPV
jgi:MOSC domain-containing protein YiiM